MVFNAEESALSSSSAAQQRQSGISLPREASCLVNPKSMLGLTNPEHAIMCGAVQRLQEMCIFLMQQSVVKC